MKDRAKTEKTVRDLALAFAKTGIKLYAVGGYPRNNILKIPYMDIDICSSLSPEKVMELCVSNNIKCIPKAIGLGTVEIHYKGLALEHTTFRTEAYDEGGAHRPKNVNFVGDVHTDARRRDFTCNALYQDLETGKILDPTGGLQDINNKLIRATSPDPSFILKDDGVRILRMVRFAGELGFTIDSDTYMAAKNAVSYLADISAERKRDELIKILLCDTKYKDLNAQGENRVLYCLKALCELGAFYYLIPELMEGKGVLQRPMFHKYDVLNHNIAASAAAKGDLILRLSALLHDIGKPAALLEKGLNMYDGGKNKNPVALKKGVTPMLNHDIIGAKMARPVLERLKFKNSIIDEVCFLIENHMYDLNFKAKDSTLRVKFALMGYDRALALCALREADICGSGYVNTFTATRWRDMLKKMQAEKTPFSLSEINCTGNDITNWLNITPCKEVGKIKELLWRHCARYPKENNSKRLEFLAKAFYNDIKNKKSKSIIKN